MKMPEPGEIWLHELDWVKTRKPRLVLFERIENGRAHGPSVQGPGAKKNGVALDEIEREWSWQGYWSNTPKTLRTLQAPYDEHELHSYRDAHHAAKLHPTAMISNSIIPSWSPWMAWAFKKDMTPLGSTPVDRSIRTVSPLAGFLCLEMRMSNLRELWYQRKRNGWHLVRTLVVRSPHLLRDVGIYR